MATRIIYDWREQPSLKDPKRALKPFGVHVHGDPSTEGSDSYGFVFVSEPMTQKELVDFTESEY